MSARRTKPGWTRAALGTVAAGICVPLLASIAAAAPADAAPTNSAPTNSAPTNSAPTNSAQAAKLAEDTAQQLTLLDEQVQQAQLQVTQEQKAAQAAAARAAAAQAAVNAFDPELRAIAQSAVAGTTESRLAAFLTSTSASDLVQQLTTLDMIAEHTETVINQVAVAADAARQAKQTADQAAARANASLAALQQERQQMQAKVNAYQADFERLSRTEQAAVTTALSGPALTANTAQIVAASPTATIATILKTALAQLGKPYVYGAEGPGSFDCSGLVAYAYASAGISLPHSSEAQSRMGRQIPRADLQPGDIVYFYTPVSHVGLYLGDGKMIEARTFGEPVAISSVDRAGYDGAVRILG